MVWMTMGGNVALLFDSRAAENSCVQHTIEILRNVNFPPLSLREEVGCVCVVVVVATYYLDKT